MWELIVLYSLNKYESFEVKSYEQCMEVAELTYLSKEYEEIVKKDDSIRILCIKSAEKL